MIPWLFIKKEEKGGGENRKVKIKFSSIFMLYIFKNIYQEKKTVKHYLLNNDIA